MNAAYGILFYALIGIAAGFIGLAVLSRLLGGSDGDGEWDGTWDRLDSGLTILLVAIFWPLVVAAGIVVGVCVGLVEGFGWLALHVVPKDKRDLS